MTPVRKLRKIIENRGECAGPMVTFKHGASGTLTHVTIVCRDNWVEVVQWIDAMNKNGSKMLNEIERARSRRRPARKKKRTA